MITATESLPQNSLDSVGLSDRTRINFMQEVSEFAEKTSLSHSGKKNRPINGTESAVNKVLDGSAYPGKKLVASSLRKNYFSC